MPKARRPVTGAGLLLTSLLVLLTIAPLAAAGGTAAAPAGRSSTMPGAPASPFLMFPPVAPPPPDAPIPNAQPPHSPLPQAPPPQAPPPPHGPDDLPRSPVPADRARAKAREVTNRREYARAKPTLVERAYGAFLRWLARLLGNANPETVAGYGPAALIILAVVAGLIIFLIVSQIRVGRRRRQGRRRKGDVVLGEGGRPANEWLEEAARFERQGRYRDAVRCQWRAVVADAAAAELLVDDSGRTTGDHRRDLAAALPVVTAPFGAATELFEQAWYSPHTIVQGDVGRIKQWTAEIRSQLPEGPFARFGEHADPAGADTGGVVTGGPS